MRKSPKKPDAPHLRAIPDREVLRLSRNTGRPTPTCAGFFQFTPARFGAIFSEAYPELSDVQRKMLAELALLWAMRRGEARSVGGGGA
jgi:hypothetical protein